MKGVRRLWTKYKTGLNPNLHLQNNSECLEWRDAIDGGEYLPGVGVDGLIYKHSRQGMPRDNTKFKEGTRGQTQLRCVIILQCFIYSFNDITRIHLFDIGDA